MQAAFMSVTITESKYCVLRIVDRGTGYSKGVIVRTRSREIMERAIKIL